MNNAERALAILNYQDYDALPLVHFGYWGETLKKWVDEGHISPGEAGQIDWNQAWVEACTKLGFDFAWHPTCDPNSFLSPIFEMKPLKVFPDGSEHFQTWQGVTVLNMPGAGSIHSEIDHLLKDRASWEEHYKPRLQWSEARFRDPWWQSITPGRFPNSGPQGLHCGSLIGMLRDTLGIVGLSYVLVDDEELFDEMVQTVADLCLQNVKAALASGRHFDYGHFWEDICYKNGPLINPQMFAEKIGPHYKRITDELRKHGVGIISVDSDGMVDDLIPVWLDNGVNTMFPIEVGTWHSSIAPWREKYGRTIRGVGGMNKNVFALDRTAIDAEIERLKPLVALGGYIPCPDHLLPPTAQWDLVRYYCDQMRAAFS